MGFRKGEYGGRFVLDQNSPVKTNIVPCNHKSSRLLVWIRDKHCVNCIQKSEHMAGVVPVCQCGIVMEDPVLSDGSAHSYITPMLSRDIGNCPLSYYISSTAPGFGEVEANLIHINTVFFNCLHTFSKLYQFFQNLTHKSKNCTHKMQNASHLLQNDTLHSKDHKHISKANICLTLKTLLP